MSAGSISARVRKTLGPAIVAACLMQVAAPRAQEQEASPLPRIAIDEQIAGSLPAIDSSAALPFAHAVRLAGDVNDRALEERLALHIARKVPVWLALTAPAAADGVEPWRAALQGLLTRHREGLAILEIEAGAEPKLATFTIRVAATEARSARASIRVAVNGSQLSSPGALAALYTAELAPYVDLLVLSPTSAQAAASAHLLRVDPDARLAILAGDAGDEAGTVARRIIDSQLETVGTDVAIVAWRSSTLIQPALRRLGADRAASWRRHHRARRARGGPGAVAGRPRRHRLHAPSAAVRQPDVRDVPRVLGRSLATLLSKLRSPCRSRARPFYTAWMTEPG